MTAGDSAWLMPSRAPFAVMEMGFTSREARLGLRQCEGNVQLAVAYIMKRREVCLLPRDDGLPMPVSRQAFSIAPSSFQEKREQEKADEEKKRQRAIAKKLGKTANGQSCVDVLSSRLLGQAPAYVFDL